MPRLNKRTACHNPKSNADELVSRQTKRRELVDKLLVRYYKAKVVKEELEDEESKKDYPPVPKSDTRKAPSRGRQFLGDKLIVGCQRNKTAQQCLQEAEYCLSAIVRK
ncbi:hypothetical protein Tco_0771100 [Tanacetum coccineum]|uniref:Uncharacterized protein n=1 Tax=Tanacetum coccineum TaxID=301880 RepID=A0ABQ4ZE13_9ASTR